MTSLLAAAALMVSESGAVDVQALLRMAEACARTGLRSEGSEDAINELLALEGEYARTAAWSCWSAGEPLPTGPSSWLLEFGEGEPTQEMLARVEPGQAVESLMLRLLHESATGGRPVLPEPVDSLVRSALENLSVETLGLVLQVYGRLGIGGLEESDALAGIGAPLVRYAAETGTATTVDYSPDAEPLARIYAARALPEDRLAPLLEDPLWAVRYEAACRIGPALLEPLLEDPVPYVALKAAAVMQEAGLGGGRVIRELALLPGPVGDQASLLLGAEDRDILAALLADDASGRRLSALQAWLGAALPIDSGMDRSLLMDPYWLVPVVYLDGLAESGDSTAAREKAERLLAARDDRNLREALSSFLGREYDLPDARLPEGIEECGCYDRVLIRTDEGDILLDLLTDTAPVTCRAFCWLARAGFYDGLFFHRVIPGFVAQAGCPQGNGYGGPGFSLPNERSLVRFRRGVVGMADSGLDTGGSQFFIMLDDHNRLDCRYTAFASVSEGDPILDRIVVGTRILSVNLLQPGD